MHVLTEGNVSTLYHAAIALSARQGKGREEMIPAQVTGSEEKGKGCDTEE